MRYHTGGGLNDNAKKTQREFGWPLTHRGTPAGSHFSKMGTRVTESTIN